MPSRYYITLDEAIFRSLQELKTWGEEVDTGHWQGVSTEGKPDLVTREIVGLSFESHMPLSKVQAQIYCKPNLPWADDHFQERVSRVPSNPGTEYKNWPWWKGQSASAMEAHSPGADSIPKFSHTYQERFWPKTAGQYPQFLKSYGEQQLSYRPNRGVRYEHGDLDDVVNLLHTHPHTRQATFPIFFPEDTGAVHGGRIPCTLHYHFLMRNNRLHLWYPMRSCDAVRHFRDDVYLATRLCQWVIEELRNADNDYPAQDLWERVTPGKLYFSAYSFHVHKGDLHLL